MYLCAHLTHKDIPRLDSLARESLYTTALAFAVTSVPGTAACFFMCHDLTSIK
jgi:hypothetical protein